MTELYQKSSKYILGNQRATFVIRTNALNTISAMIKYSNGVETTNRQTLYLKVSLSVGMCRSSGRAPIT